MDFFAHYVFLYLYACSKLICVVMCMLTNCTYNTNKVDFCIFLPGCVNATIIYYTSIGRVCCIYVRPHDVLLLFSYFLFFFSYSHSSSESGVMQFGLLVLWLRIVTFPMLNKNYFVKKKKNGDLQTLCT